MLRLLPDTRVTRASLAALALLALGAMLTLAPASSASSADVWRARFANDSGNLASLRAQLATTQREIADTKAQYRIARHNFQARIASIYKAGGTRGIDALVESSGNVSVASDRMEAMQLVARHDARIVHQFQQLVDRIPTLERKERDLRGRIASAKATVAADQREIRKAEAQAAAARAAAARMARVPESPLANPAMSPQSVSSSIAANAGGGSGGGGGPTGYSESGEASIYSNSFAGEQTANGERYDPGAMTAAHRTLPLGSWVQVSGPGGTALVRINDRGPFVGGRIIDLSPAAAAAAGVNGLGQVTIRVVG